MDERRPDCPLGTVGKYPWCYEPTVRGFLRLAMSDGAGKPSSARCAMALCVLASVAMMGVLVVLVASGLPVPDDAGDWAGWLLAMGGGASIGGRVRTS